MSDSKVAAAELITVVAIKVHASYSNGSGLLNALVSLSCKGIALVQNIPSITEGQVVKVTREQIVGNITEENVQAAYKKGVKDTELMHEAEKKREAEEEESELLTIPFKDLTEEDIEQIVEEVFEEESSE